MNEQELRQPRRCVNCGKEFVLGRGMQRRLLENPNWLIPTLCYECGMAKKLECERRKNSPFSAIKDKLSQKVE